MRKLIGFISVLGLLTLVQCEKYGVTINGSNMNCSAGVKTTDTYSLDSLGASQRRDIPKVDEFGMAQMLYYFQIKQACPGDSVTAEFTCRLGADSPKDIFVGQSVANNLDPAPGISNFVTTSEGPNIKIEGNGKFMAPKGSTSTEFTVSVSFFFQSSGDVYADLAYFYKYFKDLNIRFTYLKLPQ
jgi:hypothetical protein